MQTFAEFRPREYGPREHGQPNAIMTPNSAPTSRTPEVPTTLNSPYWPIGKRSAHICWLPMWTASPCGHIGTVDVMYPSSPFFLLPNPALLERRFAPCWSMLYIRA